MNTGAELLRLYDNPEAKALYNALAYWAFLCDCRYGKQATIERDLELCKGL